MTEIVQESEMASIRLIFERAANAIVQASELSVRVNDLSGKVETLVRDIDNAQAKNRELDQMLHDVREQRDHAKAELSQAGHRLDEQERAINSLTLTNDTQARDITRLHEALAKAQDEAKGWEQTALKADGELQEAKAMLDRLQSIFGQGLAASKPKPEPDPVQAQPEPKPRVTQSDPGFDWNKPYHWNHITQTNVQD